MMNGALLLGLKRDDLRAVCPEEGGRVFFQLQAVKSSMAVRINMHTQKYTSVHRHRVTIAYWSNSNNVVVQAPRAKINICLYIYNCKYLYNTLTFGCFCSLLVKRNITNTMAAKP